MAGTKITGTVTSTITLGSTATPAPLTITAKALVESSVNGAAGIYLPANTPGVSKIVNAGRVYGHYGTYSAAQGGLAGNGIFALSAINLVNTGTIGSLPGGAAGYSGIGGDGRTAVEVFSHNASKISNSGLLFGGNGGYGGGYGGNGGIGLISSGYSNMITNSGVITGGIGGGGGGAGQIEGSGAIGVEILGGSILNSGSIAGGAGGYAYGYSAGGNGGAGVDLEDGAVLTNTGTISGGAGGNSPSDQGNFGGSGVFIRGGTLVNAGTISGGAAGKGPMGSPDAGDAVYLYGTGASMVVAQDHAVFNGAVVASKTGADTLEVSGTSGAVLTGVGTQFTNFSELKFAAGAARGIAGSIAGIASGQRIDGFAAGDSLVFSGIAYVQGDSVSVKKNGQVTVNLNGVNQTLNIDGAKKGEKDFHLAGAALGVTLTRTASPKMAFVTPPATHAGGSEVLWQPASPVAITPQSGLWVLSATSAPAPVSLVQKDTALHFPAVVSAGHGF
jgi:hypothetical protein